VFAEPVFRAPLKTRRKDFAFGRKFRALVLCFALAAQARGERFGKWSRIAFVPLAERG